LSAQLKKLEDELGVVVFERSNKRVVITTVGKVVVAKARTILQECEQLKQIAENARDPLAGIFRLGIIPTLGPYLLPQILQPLRKELPKLDLIIHENKTENILQMLKQGELDAIILALPVNVEDFTVAELFYEPFYVALPKVHPLSKKQSLTLRDLQQETLLLLEEGHCLREQALEACALSVSKEKTGFQATSLETLRQIVAAGAGITLLPALSLTSAKQDPAIVIRPFVSPMPSRRVGMLWRKSSVRNQCCEYMIKVIREKIAKNPYLKDRAELKLMKKALS
jgi:LysR family hydrogen peroxide-inducible transcriptional activator